jgi:hypothetical protein
MDGIARGGRLLLTPPDVRHRGGRAGASCGRSRLTSTFVSIAVLGCDVSIAVLGCDAGSTAPVGISPPRAPEGPVASSSPATPRAPIVSSDFRSRMTRVGGRFLSRGHGERFDAIVWSNEAAQPAVRGRGPAPDGAVLVEEAVVRDVRGDEREGLLVMQQRDGWHFAAVDADGTAVTDERVSACAACHADAPHSVFPLVATNDAGSDDHPRPGAGSLYDAGQ